MIQPIKPAKEKLIDRIFALIAVLLLFAMIGVLIGAISGNPLKYYEDTAVNRILEINRAETKFYESEGRFGTLQELFDGRLITSPYEVESGYIFSLNFSTNKLRFEIKAIPGRYGKTGILSF